MSAAPHAPLPEDRSGRSNASLSELRARIDTVDDLLAEMLEYRAQLAVEVQRLKSVSGPPKRDFGREAEIVARMSRRAPQLGAVRLQRIMHAVIEAGLDLADERT